MKFIFDGNQLSELIPNEAAVTGYLDLTTGAPQAAFLDMSGPAQIAGQGSHMGIDWSLCLEVLLIAVAIFGLYKAITWFIHHLHLKSSPRM